MHVVSTGTVLALVVVVSLFWSRKSLTARVISVGATVTLVLLRATTLPMISGNLYQIDLENRVVSGRTILRGEDPYTFDMMVYPPTALPLFVGMASVPEPWLQRAWAVLNIAGCLALVPLSSWALWGRSEGHRRLGTLETVLLASVVGFSDSAVSHHVLGQLSVLVSLCLVGVLVLVNSGRSVAAGLLLAVASIKVATMLPFSLVFLRRPLDRRLLAAAIAGVAILSLATVRPDRLLARYSATLRNIERLSQPGRVNDYTFAGTENTSLVGLNHALYRVGLRSSPAIRLLEFGALAALGAWLARLAWRKALPRAALYSLVALYSLIFLYHRTYDLVLMALPLTYAMASVAESRGRSRLLFGAAALTMTLCLYLNAHSLFELTARREQISWVTRALALPATTWLILATLACLYWAVRREEVSKREKKGT